MLQIFLFAAFSEPSDDSIRWENALAFRAVAMTAGHAGGGPRPIDEHEAFWFQIDLSLEPVAALLQYVEAVMLDGMTSLFCASCPNGENARRTLLDPPGSYSLGAGSPVARRCACHRIAVDAATPNRTVAARQLIPS
jgi:hypothetical protein